MFLRHRIKTIAKPVAIAVSIAVTVVSMPSQASAGAFSGAKAPTAITEAANANIVEVGKRNRYYRGYHGHRRYHGRRYRRGNDVGAAVAAGIIGLAVGAAIANSHQPRRAHRATRAHRAYNGRPKPYTGAWYRYCAAKYRSFDAASGTFLSYSGVRKLCR
ncbi:MAG: BA14K family protein [Pseudomonadota bacterium]